MFSLRLLCEACAGNGARERLFISGHQLAQFHGLLHPGASRGGLGDGSTARAGHATRVDAAALLLIWALAASGGAPQMEYLPSLCLFASIKNMEFICCFTHVAAKTASVEIQSLEWDWMLSPFPPNVLPLLLDGSTFHVRSSMFSLST